MGPRGSWWSLSLLACLLGCSADEPMPRGNAGGGAQATGGVADDGAGGGSAFDNGSGQPPPVSTGADAGVQGGPVVLDGTYIWIANSSEGTVSKIDTRTMEELGRYFTSPNADGIPSRTSVGSSGAVVVANRGNGGDAGVVKIEADSARCVDRNGNGVIDTSTGRDDIRPWMEDECLIWWRPLPVYSNRPVTWAPGAGPDLPEVVWTSGASNCLADACVIAVYRLDGATGEIQAQVDIGPLSGANFLDGGGADLLNAFLGPFAGPAIEPGANYGAYGGASDGGGHFWGFICNTTHLFRVDALTMEVHLWPIPNANGYGITVDPKGRVFLCGNKGLSRFDPATQTWAETPGDLGLVGCMTDGAASIWVGGDQIIQFDADSMQEVARFPVGGKVKGTSIDFDGNVWGVAKGDAAWRLDPATGNFETFDGLVGAYSYSDMTGFGLTQAGYVPVAPQ